MNTYLSLFLSLLPTDLRLSLSSDLSLLSVLQPLLLTQAYPLLIRFIAHFSLTLSPEHDSFSLSQSLSPSPSPRSFLASAKGLCDVVCDVVRSVCTLMDPHVLGVTLSLLRTGTLDQRFKSIVSVKCVCQMCHNMVFRGCPIDVRAPSLTRG